MKKLLIALTVVLVGCEPTISDSFNLPSDLRDCTVIEMERSGFSSDKIFLIKCPWGYIGSSESHRVGKTRVQSSTYMVE